MSGVSYPFRYAYETVAASQTGQVLGTAGAPGDYLHRVIATVSTSGANGVVTLLDGATSIPLLPASTAIGVYSIDIEAAAVTVWKITTGSAATAVAVGIFSV